MRMRPGGKQQAELPKPQVVAWRLRDLKKAKKKAPADNLSDFCFIIIVIVSASLSSHLMKMWWKSHPTMTPGYI